MKPKKLLSLITWGVPAIISGNFSIHPMISRFSVG